MSGWRDAWLAAALAIVSGAAEAAAPTVTTNAATAVTAAGAMLNGTISSNSRATDVTFEYGTTASYGSSVDYASNPLSRWAVNAPVSAGVTGLTCNTVHHYRVVGQNSHGTTYGNDVTFTTAACLPPTVTTSAATGLAATGATLNGTVSSNGTATTVNFDYGTTASYGSTASYAANPLAGTATNTAVLAAVTGLTCGTLYHYRVRAANSGGTTNGGDQTFTTSACPTAVTLAKTASSSASVVNSYISFAIEATNETASALSNVVVTDSLPAGMTYSASSATVGTVAVVGQTVTWTLPSLPVGYVAQLTLVVRLTQKGSLTNTATSPGATSASATILVLPSAITTYRMDETAGSWNGTTGEVVDSGGNGLNGRRRQTATTTTNTVAPDPTIASQYPSVSGGFCNAGRFDGNAVVESASSTYFQFSQVMSASAWIYPTAYPGGDLYSILSNDVNYEFHLNTQGKLFWWWDYSTLTSAATIPLNQWTHVAITLDSTAANRRQRIYINGVLDTNTNNWTGTLRTNNCPFYVGGDIGTNSGCALIPGRNFRGMIDEASIYDYEMTAAEVQAAMRLGRQCSGTFHHIEIVHDGSASVCTSKTVTLKACLDAACTVLYPGAVSVQLSPTGWTPSDTINFSGGVATATLVNTAITPPSITLGTVSVTPAPSGTTTCYDGNTQNCTLAVVSSSCLADAVEVGSNPYTNLYTKLAATAFNIDLLAIASGAVNTLYIGTMNADLVDADSGCSASSTPLNTAQAVTFVAANRGRKTVSMTSPVAHRKAQVRMRIGSSYACSADRFAIRPSSFSVSADLGAATLKAGRDFTITADSGVPSNYTGRPYIDVTRLRDHLGNVTSNLTDIDPITHTDVNTSRVEFGDGNGIAATGTFQYHDVGTIRFDTDAVIDASYTTIDQPSDCVMGSTANSASGGKFGCNIGSTANATNYGRFYPDHFNYAATLTAGCNGFTYMGQPRLGVELTLSAVNLNGAVTPRYTAGYSHLATFSITAAGGGSVARMSPVLPAFDWSSGSYTVSEPATSYTRATDPDGSFESFALQANILAEPDGVQILIPGIPPDPPAYGNTQSSNATKIRFGRLRLSNVYGSLSPLAMPVEAQYWTGNSWVRNSDDNCTAITTANVWRSVAGWTPTGPGVLAGGVGTISLVPAAPGSATVCADLDADHGLACAATSAALPWLQSRWPGAATWDNDPSATATFGVFSPEGRRGVYNREMY